MNGSVLPGYYGLEAGQSAVGDIFNWFVNYIQPGGEGRFARRTHARARPNLQPGESRPAGAGLEQRQPHDPGGPAADRACCSARRSTPRRRKFTARLIEATAFGALTIINRFEEYGVKVQQIVNCGGIAEKNPLVMQIYADVTGRPMKVVARPRPARWARPSRGRWWPARIRISRPPRRR